MECITCGLEAGYNRAVIDRFSGIELGRFCLRCERTEFGYSLERAHWMTADGCAFCERDGHYALPKWEPYVTEREAGIHCAVDYELTETTLTLCDEHLHEIWADGNTSPAQTSTETDTA